MARLLACVHVRHDEAPGAGVEGLQDALRVVVETRTMESMPRSSVARMQSPCWERMVLCSMSMKM